MARHKATRTAVLSGAKISPSVTNPCHVHIVSWGMFPICTAREGIEPLNAPRISMAPALCSSLQCGHDATEHRSA